MTRIALRHFLLGAAAGLLLFAGACIGLALGDAERQRTWQ